MQFIRRILRLIESLIVAAVIGTVALVSSVIDGMIGLVSRLSDRFDAKLAELARESRARHQREGRRQIDPITLK